MKIYMLPEGVTVDNATDDQLKTALKKTRDIRDEMGGQLYWSIMDDQCTTLERKCKQRGIDISVIYQVDSL